MADVFIGSDHGGFKLKEGIKKYLELKGVGYIDLGTFSEESVSYVDYSYSVAKKVSENDSFGIICCSSGIGVSIVANKVPEIRAALCTSDFHAEFARRHNNANVICFGQKVTDIDYATKMVDIFLSTEFDGGRHKKRLESIREIEKRTFKEKT